MSVFWCQIDVDILTSNWFANTTVFGCQFYVTLWCQFDVELMSSAHWVPRHVVCQIEAYDVTSWLTGRVMWTDAAITCYTVIGHIR